MKTRVATYAILIYGFIVNVNFFFLLLPFSSSFLFIIHNFSSKFKVIRVFYLYATNTDSRVGLIRAIFSINEISTLTMQRAHVQYIRTPI